MKIRTVRLLGIIVLSLGSIGSLAQSGAPQNRPAKPMRWSCREGISLTAAVSTPRRDHVPEIHIRLMSPSKRQQGVEVSQKRLPHSHYEIIAQLPEHPEISTERAVEVCDAEQGEYTLTIYEHGDKPYEMYVGASDEKNSLYLPKRLLAREGRVRTFTFLLQLQRGGVQVSWLEGGEPPYAEW